MQSKVCSHTELKDPFFGEDFARAAGFTIVAGRFKVAGRLPIFFTLFGLEFSSLGRSSRPKQAEH